MKKTIVCVLLLMVSISAFGKRKLKIIYSNQNNVKKAHTKEIKRAKSIDFDRYIEGLKKETTSTRIPNKSKNTHKKVENTVNNKENIKSNSIETKEQTVYITKTGKKYHKKSCRYSKHARAVSLKKAKNLGLKPCKVCKP